MIVNIHVPAGYLNTGCILATLQMKLIAIGPLKSCLKLSQSMFYSNDDTDSSWTSFRLVSKIKYVLDHQARLISLIQVLCDVSFVYIFCETWRWIFKSQESHNVVNMKPVLQRNVSPTIFYRRLSYHWVTIISNYEVDDFELIFKHYFTLIWNYIRALYCSVLSNKFKLFGFSALFGAHFKWEKPLGEINSRP